LYGIKIWTDRSFVLSHFVWWTDRRTDTFLATRPPCIQCSLVKLTCVVCLSATVSLSTLDSASNKTGKYLMLKLTEDAEN